MAPVARMRINRVTYRYRLKIYGGEGGEFRAVKRRESVEGDARALLRRVLEGRAGSTWNELPVVYSVEDIVSWDMLLAEEKCILARRRRMN